MSTLIEVIINAGSGSVEQEATERTLAEAFKRHNLTVHLHLAKEGAEIVEFAKSAAASDAAIVVAGGGDGTISAVAQELIGSNKTLGVLPLGTLNNFSKDLHIPKDLDEAVKIIAQNHVKIIDVGEVNQRIFINNSSIGLYPHIVEKREAQQRLGHGKWRSAFWAALEILKQSPFLASSWKASMEFEPLKRRSSLSATTTMKWIFLISAGVRNWTMAN